MDHFFHHDLGLKRPTEDQTEAIHYARLSHSKQLLNDEASFGSLIKMYSHYPHSKIPIITDCMHPLQQRRKTSEQNAFFAQE